MAITVDIGVRRDIIPQWWNNFLSYVYSSYPDNLKDYRNYRHCIDKELKPYKATWVTDTYSYSKLVFENEKYKTLFMLRWP
jgi:hypothetical protein